MTSDVRSSPKTVIGVGTVSVLVIALVGLAVALRTIGDDEAPARRIGRTGGGATGRVDAHGRHSIPDATVTKIASSAAGTVAIGRVENRGTIWYSSDGATWDVAYSPAQTLSSSGRAPSLAFQDVVVTTRWFLATTTEQSDSTQAIATVLTSPDGRSWQFADQDAFVPASNAPTKGIGSGSTESSSTPVGSSRSAISSPTTSASAPASVPSCGRRPTAARGRGSWSISARDSIPTSRI